MLRNPPVIEKNGLRPGGLKLGPIGLKLVTWQPDLPGDPPEPPVPLPPPGGQAAPEFPPPSVFVLFVFFQ